MTFSMVAVMAWWAWSAQVWGFELASACRVATVATHPVIKHPLAAAVYPYYLAAFELRNGPGWRIFAARVSDAELQVRMKYEN